MFLFTFLLYHILNHLSRGFFIFFLGAVGDSNPHFNFSPHLGDTLTCSPMGLAFVSCVSSTFFQPARSGSHLYSAHRNTMRSGHGAEVLLTLVGLSLWDCLALSFCTLIVSHFKGFVKRFFELFRSVGRFCFTSPNYALGRGCSLLSASLHPYCITTWVICQEVFQTFLKNLFGWLYRTPTNALGCVAYYPRLLTMIVYHTPPQKSTWQNAQIRASKLFDFCTTFLLTNCWRCGIMEILAAHTRGRRAQN